MSRTPLIAANWKMYKTEEEANAFFNTFNDKIKDCENDILICPSFSLLSTVKKRIAAASILLGAQNVHSEEEGAFTGEVSAGMLKSVGCRYVIIGHSERRQLFHENNELLNKKINKSLEHGLQIVYCVGETIEERELNKTNDVIAGQLVQGFNGVSQADMDHIVVAYEPVWAIGTGKTATPQQAEAVHAFIRSLLEKQFGKEVAEQTRILYGGSVKPANSKELLSQENIDGALVGGASLDPEQFAEICRS